jgi:glycosyltransferase involved in cell wall biosynthesis
VKIAHIGSKGVPSLGGTERVVEAVAVVQAARHDVTVYGSRHVCRSGTSHGVRVVTMPTSRGKYSGPVILQTLCALHALGQGYDVVHVHGAENAFVVPLLRLRSAVVTTNHGPTHERLKWAPMARRILLWLEGLSVRCGDAATAVAKEHADRLERRYRRRVKHIPNGIETDGLVDEEGAEDVLAAAGLARGEYLLFAAGRVDPTKGCHTLLEAVRRLPEPPPVLVLGDLSHAPGYETELRASAEGLPVRFVPRLDSRPVVLGLLHGCRLFVFPSTVEGMSMMLLDAVSQGAPTLASDIPENTSVLPPEVSVFRARDASALSVALREALAVDPAAGRRTAAAASEWVVARFSWIEISQAYESVYREAVRHRGRRIQF